MPIQHCNDTLNDLSISERIRYIFTCYSPEEILITSSFGISSAYLLYHISRFEKKPDIHFINTGFHFSSTLKYRDDLADIFGLNIVEIAPEFEDHSFTEYEKLWKTDPDSCCFINKVKPMDNLKSQFKVWVTGLMANQSAERKKTAIVEVDKPILKFNPLFDENPNVISEKLKKLKIPLHPLHEKDYNSVGCLQCTDRGEGRSGRWQGLGKTECGLHNNINKKYIP
ncbi:MAG: phosphoadenylyl-sulfate reductase [Calditrichaeota bacterium]|nr:MAG: phosphoadenylyl-sulfate reductase [Calditrichota bacterium]MBL1207024.1 phosphoadenylyl-sulfate reductase [Calditrichota bacterium]NOG46851.1 phosphoadenylyl-sulfate reductase [Calditrichota bacterium]